LGWHHLLGYRLLTTTVGCNSLVILSLYSKAKTVIIFHRERLYIISYGNSLSTLRWFRSGFG
jgi:hypothetical protein